ncbi:MAG: methyltransferase domain-containing protein [Theionarchaea archaeon]|nr:methyltransferase domain-containing protein [Theionarchaea archaeon]
MYNNNWRIWETDPSVESTLFKRATGELPEMESTKQLVEMVEEVYEPGMRILDVGCGPGHYYRGLQRINESIDYLGVDATSLYIDSAENIFRGTSARFIVGDIFDMPDDIGEFEIVFCCNVILHLPDFRIPMKNLLKVCRGYCFIRTLISDNTYLHKFVKGDEFDEMGNPKKFIYQNTYSFELLKRYVGSLGTYYVELIEDRFDPRVLAGEYDTVKRKSPGATRILEGFQVSGNLIFEWRWLKISLC